MSAPAPMDKIEQLYGTTTVTPWLPPNAMCCQYHTFILHSKDPKECENHETIDEKEGNKHNDIRATNLNADGENISGSGARPRRMTRGQFELSLELASSEDDSDDRQSSLKTHRGSPVPRSRSDETRPPFQICPYHGIDGCEVDDPNWFDRRQGLLDHDHYSADSCVSSTNRESLVSELHVRHDYRAYVGPARATNYRPAQVEIHQENSEQEANDGHDKCGLHSGALYDGACESDESSPQSSTRKVTKKATFETLGYNSIEEARSARFHPQISWLMSRQQMEEAAQKFDDLYGEAEMASDIKRRLEAENAQLLRELYGLRAFMSSVAEYMDKADQVGELERIKSEHKDVVNQLTMEKDRLRQELGDKKDSTIRAHDQIASLYSSDAYWRQHAIYLQEKLALLCLCLHDEHYQAANSAHGHSLRFNPYPLGNSYPFGDCHCRRRPCRRRPACSCDLSQMRAEAAAVAPVQIHAMAYSVSAPQPAPPAGAQPQSPMNLRGGGMPSSSFLQHGGRSPTELMSERHLRRAGLPKTERAQSGAANRLGNVGFWKNQTSEEVRYDRKQKEAAEKERQEEDSMSSWGN